MEDILFLIRLIFPVVLIQSMISLCKFQKVLNKNNNKKNNLFELIFEYYSKISNYFR